MVKGKIQVLAGGVIAGRSKPVQVALSERSTAREVVGVILKKYGLEDDPFDYQVWVVCPPQPGESNRAALCVQTLAYPLCSTLPDPDQLVSCSSSVYVRLCVVQITS